MAINVACPTCGRPYVVKDDAVGKRFRCKDCEELVEVPAGAGGDAAGDDPFAPDAAGDIESRETGIPAPVTGRRRISPPMSEASPEVKSQTLWPAACMYVVCALSLITFSILAIGELIGLSEPLPEFLSPEQREVAVSRRIGFIAVAGLGVMRDFLLILAFTRLQAARSYGIAMAGAIVSVIPCLGSPCCLAGIPFGIWALVVLNDPVVKAGFR